MKYLFDIIPYYLLTYYMLLLLINVNADNKKFR